MYSEYRINLDATRFEKKNNIYPTVKINLCIKCQNFGPAMDCGVSCPLPIEKKSFTHLRTI